MSLIVSRVGEHVGAQRCSIVFVDEGAERCFVMAASDNPGADMLAIDLGKYPEIRRAIETRGAGLRRGRRPPIRRSRRSGRFCSEQGYRSLLVMPLVYGKEVLGTLFLRASRELPVHRHRAAVSAGSPLAASANALKNALLYRDVAQESARHRATGEKLRRVLDGTPDVIVATDAAGRITEFNRAAEDLTGCFAQRGPRPAARRRSSRRRRPHAEVGREGPGGLSCTRPDGAVCEIHLVCAPLTDDSGGLGRARLPRDGRRPTCGARKRASRRRSGSRVSARSSPAWRTN